MAFMAERILIEGEPALLHAVVGDLRFHFRASLPVRLVWLAILRLVPVEDNIVTIGVPPGRIIPTRGVSPVAGETHYLGTARVGPHKIGVIGSRMRLESAIIACALFKGYQRKE